MQVPQHVRAFQQLPRRRVCRPQDAVDVACLRQALKEEKHTADEDGRFPLSWVPTTVQRADLLTKPMKAEAWWQDSTSLYIPVKSLVFDQCKSEE